MAAVTAREMREIDRIAVEESGPTLLQMMENAGRSMAVLAMRELAGDLASRSVLVLTGRGGNGGGGICAARHLVPRVGRVTLSLADPERASEAARQQLALYRGTAGAIVAVEALGTLEPHDLIIDAVVGYGLRGAPQDWPARAIEWANRSPATVISLDVPSGLDADSSEAPGACVRADATLTLHMPKPGLASPVAGRLFVADLGIPAAVTRRLGIEAPEYGKGFIAALERG
jgi:NAD(P)H-hydrate epimerase